MGAAQVCASAPIAARDAGGMAADRLRHPAPLSFEELKSVLEPGKSSELERVQRLIYKAVAQSFFPQLEIWKARASVSPSASQVGRTLSELRASPVGRGGAAPQRLGLGADRGGLPDPGAGGRATGGELPAPAQHLEREHGAGPGEPLAQPGPRAAAAAAGPGRAAAGRPGPGHGRQPLRPRVAGPRGGQGVAGAPRRLPLLGRQPGAMGALCLHTRGGSRGAGLTPDGPRF